MTDFPSVSVIIPTYRRAPLLEEALESVFAQTLTDGEVIVVEDGSHDASDAVARYGDRVRYEWQPNQGPAVARNRGADLASAEWLAFLDDDDLWLPEKLERQLLLARQLPELGMVHTDHYHLEQGRLRPAPRSTPRGQVPSGWVGKALFLDNFVLTSSTLVRKRDFERFGGFDPRFRAAQDYHLWVRLARQRPVAFLAEPLAIYRVHTPRISTDDLTVAPTKVIAFESLVRETPSLWTEYGRRTVKRRLYALRLDCALTYFYADRYAEARRHFLWAWRWRPGDLKALGYALACATGFRGVTVLRRLKWLLRGARRAYAAS